jgi:hypothetical protein
MLVNNMLVTNITRIRLDRNRSTKLTGGALGCLIREFGADGRR